MICLLVNFIMISFLPQKSVKTKNNNNNNNNNKLAAKRERFVSLLFRTAIAYYVRTPFPLPSLLLKLTVFGVVSQYCVVQ